MNISLASGQPHIVQEDSEKNEMLLHHVSGYYYRKAFVYKSPQNRFFSTDAPTIKRTTAQA